MSRRLTWAFFRLGGAILLRRHRISLLGSPSYPSLRFRASGDPGLIDSGTISGRSRWPAHASHVDDAHARRAPGQSPGRSKRPTTRCPIRGRTFAAATPGCSRRWNGSRRSGGPSANGGSPPHSDRGFGTGAEALAMRRRFPAADIVGIEFSREIDRGRTRVGAPASAPAAPGSGSSSPTARQRGCHISSAAHFTSSPVTA